MSDNTLALAQNFIQILYNRYFLISIIYFSGAACPIAFIYFNIPITSPK